MKVFFTDHFHDRFKERFPQVAADLGVNKKTMFQSIDFYKKFFNESIEMEPSEIPNINLMYIIKKYGANTVCHYFYNSELDAIIVVILDEGKFKAVTIYNKEEAQSDVSSEDSNDEYLELSQIEQSYLVRNMLDSLGDLGKIPKHHTFTIFFRGKERTLYSTNSKKSGYKFKEL